jgi:hypothetical protein
VTKDILHVKELLGHKRFDNTLLYVQIDKALPGESEEHIVKIARTAEEVKALLEAGFEYVFQKDGEVFLRKRK